MFDDEFDCNDLAALLREYQSRARERPPKPLSPEDIALLDSLAGQTVTVTSHRIDGGGVTTETFTIAVAEPLLERTPE